MKNIEIKYKVPDFSAVTDLFSRNKNIRFVWKKYQQDVYYHVPKGRLKLRLEDDSTPHLISYSRADISSQRESEYFIYESSDAENLKIVLADALGVKIVVKKHRSQYRYKNVRIHLDLVENLGNFIEVESVIADKYTEEAAQKNLEELLGLFSKIKLKPVSVSYSNLLENQERR